MPFMWVWYMDEDEEKEKNQTSEKKFVIFQYWMDLSVCPMALKKKKDQPIIDVQCIYFTL